MKTPLEPGLHVVTLDLNGFYLFESFEDVTKAKKKKGYFFLKEDDHVLILDVDSKPNENDQRELVCCLHILSSTQKGWIGMNHERALRSFEKAK